MMRKVESCKYFSTTPTVSVMETKAGENVRRQEAESHPAQLAGATQHAFPCGSPKGKIESVAVPVSSPLDSSQNDQHPDKIGTIGIQHSCSEEQLLFAMD
eukprot:TRINITY_DN6844_c2_g1_i2.p2 TRINITY_DN6844_c2_g1~~TRINITY_DN6844_c2_g1_i2.p2  ORF type:complete len:100 (+),score=9.29 TRINITY_DN6844_c2_g1_i2:386-685(+)